MLPIIGVVMSGGGARAAFQSGVLSAIAEISVQLKLENRMKIFTGSSAGSVNASFLAAGSENFYDATKNLVDLWSQLRSEQVFASDPISLGKLGMKWFDSGGETFRSRSFLDTTPLEELLNSNIQFDQIQKNIQNEHLIALAVTAVDYNDSQSVTFVQGRSDLKPWYKAKRFSQFTKIDKEHILASSAIPILFPPRIVGDRFYGDGCVGQLSPCGPSIYLGSEKLIVIGVQKRHPQHLPTIARPPSSRPSLIGVFNTLLDTVMFDGMEKDLEKLDNTNNLIASLSAKEQERFPYKKIKYLYFSPSVDLAEIAHGLSHRLPRIVRFMLRGLGSLEDASEIVSYLLFDPAFCTHLIDIGFESAMKRKEEIEIFLTT